MVEMLNHKLFKIVTIQSTFETSASAGQSAEPSAKWALPAHPHQLLAISGRGVLVAVNQCQASITGYHRQQFLKCLVSDGQTHSILYTPIQLPALIYTCIPNLSVVNYLLAMCDSDWLEYV